MRRGNWRSVSGGEGLFIEPRLDIRPVEVKTAVDVLCGWKSAAFPMAPAPQGHRTDVEDFAQRRPCDPTAFEVREPLLDRRRGLKCAPLLLAPGSGIPRPAKPRREDGRMAYTRCETFWVYRAHF